MLVISPFLEVDEGVYVESRSHLYVLNNSIQRPKYIVREHSETETSDILNLFYEVFREFSPPSFFPTDNDNEKCFVCVLDAPSPFPVILGFAKFNICYENNNYYGCIQALAVIPSLRGNGIGSSLMREIEKYCKQSTLRPSCITLTTQPYNTNAIKLYEKEGFEFLRIDPAYYNLQGRIYDGIVMTKYLHQ